MPVKFIMGRSGTGKTEKSLEQIRERLKEQPAGDPILYIVPDQMTFDLEWEMARTEGLNGMTRLNVFSFQRLALRILQQTGKLTRYHLTQVGVSMLLQKIVEEHKNELKVFQKASEQRGFFDMLSGTMTEFKRYCVSPEDLFEKKQTMLDEMAGQDHTLLQDKLDDLYKIYQKMEQELIGKYLDSEDYLTLLAEQLDQSEWLSRAEVFIDGFDVVTPQEIRVIQELMRHTKKVTILLTCDDCYENHPQPLHLFRQNASNYKQMYDAAIEADVEIEEPVILDEPLRYTKPALRHLEQYYEKRPYVIQQDSSGIDLIESVNRREEVDQAARQILEWVREGGLRYNDIAVLVRQLPIYAPLVETVFKDYDIPVFLDQKRPMRHHPLIELVRSVLEVIRQNWRYEAVFRAVKTDLLLPLEGSIQNAREGMDQLENYVIAYGIHGDRWKNKQSFMERHKVTLEDASYQQSETSQHQLIETMRAYVTAPITKLEKKLTRAASLLEMGEALYTFLIDCDIPKKIEMLRDRAEKEGRLDEAREHEQVWQAVMDTLDQMIEAAGTEKLSIDLFIKILDTGLDSLQFALVPPALDQVVIGSMDRSRVSSKKAVMILGINEGVIPASPSENGILSDEDRDQLAESGLTLALDTRTLVMDEEFLIYRSLSSPRENLYLSYPVADEEGKALAASSLISRLRRIFPDLTPELAVSEPHDLPNTDQINFVTSPYKTLSSLAGELRQVKRGYPAADQWWEVYNWYVKDPLWKGQAMRVLGSLFYTNQSSLQKETAQALYGKKIRASVSRMEQYNSCPFAQFANYGLKLKERQVYRLEAPDIGQFFHAALKGMTDQLMKDKKSWRDLSVKECEQLAAHFVQELSPRLSHQILMSSNRHQYLHHKLEQIMMRAAKVMRQHDMASGFTPVGLELPFGPNAPLPPLIFELDNGCRMEIIGRIDRVDKGVNDAGVFLRIIDYKSSVKDLSLTEVYYGLALQMLTYLDVVLTYAKDWLGVEAGPGGMLYFHVHNPMLNITQKLSEDEIEAQLMKAFKMKGLLLADEAVVRSMDESLETGYSTVLPAAIKKDGSFYSSSSVADKNAFDVLRAYTRRMIQEVGQGITEGNISISPYRLNNRTPCEFCSYRPVCQFDQSKEGNQYRFLKKQKDNQVLEQMKEKEGGHAHDVKNGEA